MAATLTPAEREEYGPIAYKMSLARSTAQEIAGVLSARAGHVISEKAVDRLLKAERRKVREARESDDQDDLGQYLAELDFAMSESVKRATNKGTSATASAAHWANFIGASKNKATALGVVTSRTDITTGGKNLAEALDIMLKRVVIFSVPDDANPFPDGD